MRPDSPSPVIPFLIACAGIATFSAMDVLMKGLSIDIGAYNAVLWRTGAGTILSGAIYFASRPAMPDRATLRIHAIRSLFVAGMAVSFFWALARLPMAEAKMAEPMEIAFFQNGFVALILAVGAPWLLAVPGSEQAIPLVGAAFLAVTSLLLLSWAYARAEAQILATTEYTGFLWAMLFGWMFFDEAVTWPTIIGAVLIVVGCLIVARKTPQLDPIEPAAA